MCEIVSWGKKLIVLFGIYQYVFEDIFGENNFFFKDDILFIDFDKML